MSSSKLEQISLSELDQMSTQISIYVNDFMTPLNDVLKSYSEDLDILMIKVRKEVFADASPSSDTLERYLSQLTAVLYFMGEKLEQLNTFVYMSSAQEKEVYNNIYLENRIKSSDKTNKMTVAELQSLSEEGSKTNNVLTAIYKRAYSSMKYKIEAAQEMIRSISKILSKRMQEESMTNTRVINTGKQILNESEPF